VIPPQSVIGLDRARFVVEEGLVQFTDCPPDRWDVPLCPFGLGTEATLQGYRIAFRPEGETWQELRWTRQPGCILQEAYRNQPEAHYGYFTAQAYCPDTRPLEAPRPDAVIVHRGGMLPYALGAPFGQLALTETGAAAPSTTLTSFAVERPMFPAIWGVHWLPVLAPLAPPRWWTWRHGETYDEADHLGQPEGSLHDMALSIGWSQKDQHLPAAAARMAAVYPYEADHALPALRSRSFFPVRYALELVCAPGLRDSVTPAVMAEVGRLAQGLDRYNNDLPQMLAQEALDSGCGADVAMDD
jgi:hypothetical protein